MAAPYTAVLLPQSSVSYSVTASSTNGQTGYVSLSLDPNGLPAGVSYSFSTWQVYLSGTGSTATSYLTFYGSPSMPPGTFPLHVVGMMGSLQHSAIFPLSTQVTTFQVTSVTGSAIVHNTGQEVQVTHNVTAGNPPTYTTCGSADSNVTCRVISSYWNSVTLGITAGTSALHGTRVLSLNGGSATLQAVIADRGGGGGLPTITVPAGESASVDVDVPIESCYIDGPCGYATVTSPAGWISGGGFDGLVEVSVDPPPTTPPGSYAYSINLCNGFFDPDEEYSCQIGGGDVEVQAAPPPPPPPPICTLDFQYRGLAFPVIGLVVGHSYLHFTQSAGPVINDVIEGFEQGGASDCGSYPPGTLLAWQNPNGLPADNKNADPSATTNGALIGAYVCAWLKPLQDAVSRINAAHIPYSCTGPNSNSVTRYMLSQLPTTITPWWTYPGVFGLTGFYTLLPGVEQ